MPEPTASLRPGSRTYSGGAPAAATRLAEKRAEIVEHLFDDIDRRIRARRDRRQRRAPHARLEHIARRRATQAGDNGRRVGPT
eukprot:3641157-Prymnesium_polylepis.1